MRAPRVAFVTSAADAEGFPKERLPELAMVGRSNVGKSSLINALVRQTLARTSAAPGKTRLANFFRVDADGHPAFFLVDLPGYGYARGGDAARAAFDQLAADYFGAGILSLGGLIGASFQKYPNIDRWTKTMRALPSWGKVNEAAEGFAASLKGKTFVTIGA